MRRRLVLPLLVFALGAGGAQPLSLPVQEGDTPSGLLVQHFTEIRQVLPSYARGTARDLAYRLLARSPQVADAVLHPGDRLLVLPNARLRLDTSPVYVPPPSEPPPPPPAPPPALPAPPPEPVVGPVAPPPAPPPGPAWSIDADGRRLHLPGGVDVETAPGLQLFDRGGLLHIVKLGAPPWEVSFPVPESGALRLPPNPCVKLSADGRHLVAATFDEDPSPYIERGELNIHDDHLHMTAKFPSEPWRQLYAARSDPKLDALRQKAAAALIVKLLETHIARDPGRFGESLSHQLQVVERVWRSFDHGVEAREIADQMDLDYEVAPDGRSVRVGDRVWVTASPLRFESCSGHFHVLGTSDDHRFAAKIPVESAEAFRFPSSPFFETVGNVVVPKAPMELWMTLVRTGALEQRRGHYHVTQRWEQPSVAALGDLMDRARGREVRDEATGALFRVLSVPMEPVDEADLRRQLDEMAKMADGEYTALVARAHEKGWVLDR